jgi:predicted SnoaL-like aldol condensation-catalyzing enzyme
MNMSATLQETNKALLLEGFDMLFNRRDFEAAKRYWSPDYIQHSSHIAPGRDGLFDLVKGLTPETKYEHGVLVAEGDFVMAHGRYRDPKGVSLIVVDVMRIQNRQFQEHWDVIQEEAKEAESKSGLPMFGESFPES